MASQAKARYDIITVGGGLGGSALAKTMAEHDARVLVLERQKHFKDRVLDAQCSMLTSLSNQLQRC